MNLLEIMGDLEGPGEFLKRRRAHQAWWRAFVLDLPQGEHKGRSGTRPVSSRMPPPPDGHWPNFVSEEVGRLAESLVEDRVEKSANDTKPSGIVDVSRLKTNLLSSQPLALNFFGPLAVDPKLDLANRVLRPLLSLPGRVLAIHFEYAPGQPTGDNSAFDVAVEWDAGCGERGLAGIEVKYTETFSPEPARDREQYRKVFDLARAHFTRDYGEYFTAETNQLWRGQMLAHALLQRHRAGARDGFTRVMNYVFFADADQRCRKTVAAFQDMLSPTTEVPLKLVTMEEFISEVQQQELSWEERRWTMMLWARYVAMELSDAALGKRFWEEPAQSLQSNRG